jgi:hypothetical protein
LRAVDEAIDDLIQNECLEWFRGNCSKGNSTMSPSKKIEAEVCALFQGADRFIWLAMQENRLSLPLESQIDRHLQVQKWKV